MADPKEIYHPLQQQSTSNLSNLGEEDASRIDAILNEEKMFYKLAPDTWGVTLFAIINDLPDILVKEASTAQIVRFSFAMGVLILNVVMQVLILHWVGLYVVGESVREMQLHYQQYHARSFDPDGTFNEERWEGDLELRTELCDAALGNFPFLSFISFLWAARILQEIRSIAQLDERVRSVHTLPSGAPNAHMVCERERAGAGHVYDIVALSRQTRWSLYVLVLIPKACIAMFLMYIGVKWLASTANFKNLILNALGLEFVLHIDELFFVSLFPEEEHNTVVSAYWAAPKPNLTQAQEYRKIKLQYMRCAGWISLAMGFVYLYLTEFQDVLPKYDWDLNHCRKFMQEYLSPLCASGDSGPACFPFGR